MQNAGDVGREEMHCNILQTLDSLADPAVAMMRALHRCFKVGLLSGGIYYVKISSKMKLDGLNKWMEFLTMGLLREVYCKTKM